MADRVVHVHVSDRYAHCGHAVTGDGAVDFPTIFRLLHEAGFDGWLSLEAGGPSERESVVRGLEFIKGAWAAATS